jgi:hypothetical protein
MTEHQSASRLSAEELRDIDAYWRAANYLTIGQIYLLDNPLLREPLWLEHVKPRLLGLGEPRRAYAHLNRAIRLRDANVIYVCGPGHGGPATIANTYLEGTYSEINLDVALDEVSDPVEGRRHAHRHDEAGGAAAQQGFGETFAFGGEGERRAWPYNLLEEGFELG